jgi:cytochrome d ubiquinol oxidase subunit II
MFMLARGVAPFTGAAVIGFIIWTHVSAGSTFFLNVIELLAVLAAIAAVWLVYEHREGFNLTVHNTASGPYSLKVMTVVVVIFLPLVLAYQVWTYYVFRKRVSTRDFQPAAPSPEAATPPVHPGS